MTGSAALSDWHPTLWDVLQRAIGLVLVVVTLMAAQDLPRYGVPLFVAGALYLLAVIRRPRLWLLVLPLFCVTVDLAPWTGRFVYNELDVLFWLTIAAALICARYRLPDPGALASAPLPTRIGGLAFGAFIALALAGATGLGAVVDPPGPAFTNPYRVPEYSYKVVKGLLWGALLAPLWLELRRASPRSTLECLYAGAVLAALALFAVILWERGTLAALAAGPGAALASFGELGTWYRTIGLFSDMHTGGEVLDGTIVLLLAINLYAALRARTTGLRSLAMLACAALIYVTLVGFTRATYGAVILTVALAVAVELYRLRRRLQLSLFRVALLAALLPAFFVASYGTALSAGSGRLLWVLPLEALVLWRVFRSTWRPLDSTGVGGGLRGRLLILSVYVLLPALFAVGLTAETMDRRMAGVDRDLDTRLAHWARVVELGQRGIAGNLLGQGAGHFPKLYAAAYAPEMAWVGDFAIEDDPHRLRLNGGGDLIVYQRVAPQTRQLRLAVTARAPEGGRLAVGLCARNVLDTGWSGGRCDRQILHLAASAEFLTLPVALRLPVEGYSAEAAGWPRALHLSAAGEGQATGGQVVEISSVVRTDGGTPPAYRGFAKRDFANPDFAQGLDHWFFTTDFGHLPFHIKNIWLQFWFDHGWVGLLLMLVLAGLLPWRVLREPAVSPVIGMAAVAIASFAALGLFGTPLDSARISWLFYLLLLIGVFEPARGFAEPVAVPAGRGGRA